MPLWRCPHCATPQAETARCWVCHRSSTACGACRHFRRSVAAQLGYCGLDRQREPLTGNEVRPCWEAADATGASVPSLPGVGPVWPLEPDEDRTSVRPVQFVEVQSNRERDGRAQVPPAKGDATSDVGTDPIFLSASADGEQRWSLWGDVEA